ncbi:hypothetical protein [Aureimonas phyllosphaerae]|uniref:Lipoprotein n=1 Tax=Aureimonas phyllosphaerae TaxID=1166078 RepID=A0A7W6BQT4_9HYPH|nr:hypothetical protein [Aureimonas phyllosphaerae]MBB3936353.1 hypothetical protein [Aureimonas phyllosphaerae]MBB3959922.1 hypothetical protein [Aureimonas phyllosphaerae]SFF48269.1 hypothetical protein SAMN05216566_11699 [Aureimonas phyllosphaerae]
MRPVLPFLAVLALSGCTAVDGPAFDGRPTAAPTLGLAPASYRPPVRRGCDNYADQTARNTYENLADNEDGFGANAFARTQAERDGARAYRRCVEGRRS